MDNFEHVLKSIIIPMTASTGTKARGRIYIATTPSETPGHDSMTVYEEYSRQGLVSEFTLNDNPRIPYDEKVEMLLEYGEDPKRVPDILTGKARAQMSRTRREYYGEWVTEAASAVVPSFTREAQDEIVREVGPPPFRDCFTALDPGYEHQTGALFAYFDFIKQQLVIEDEWAERHVGTPAIAAAIQAREEKHYPPTANVSRVSDHDKRLIRDLMDLYEMPFGMANKKDLKANAALLDAWVRSRQLVINPRCKNLIRQLQNATWNKKGNKIAEDSSSDNLDAHYDLVAAAIYLVRLVNTSRHRNPYPENWLHRGFDDHVSVKNRGPSGRSTGILGGNTPAGRKLHGRRGRK